MILGISQARLYSASTLYQRFDKRYNLSLNVRIDNHPITFYTLFMKRKSDLLEPATKEDVRELLKEEIQEAKKELREEIHEFKDDIMTKLDDIAGQLETMRDENTICSYQTRNLNET